MSHCLNDSLGYVRCRWVLGTLDVLDWKWDAKTGRKEWKISRGKSLEKITETLSER